MNRSGSAADWSLSGTHTMKATLRVVSVTSNVCVGQIHLGTGGTSTKPLLELYYRSSGDIVLGTGQGDGRVGQRADIGSLHIVGAAFEFARPVVKAWSATSDGPSA